MGRNNRNYQHRGAVARDATDAVLVGYQVAMPVQALALGHHGACQVHYLFTIQSCLPGRYQEGRDLHPGIAPLRDVARNASEFLRLQAFALDLPTHSLHRLRWACMLNPYCCACFKPQPLEGLL